MNHRRQQTGHRNRRNVGRLAAALVICALACVLSGALVSAALASPVSKALGYFHTCQTKAGGFSGPGLSQADLTPWVIMAVKAAGQNPSSSTWRKGSRTPIQYLQSLNLKQAAAASSSAPAFYAKVMLAYRAAGQAGLISHAGSGRLNLVSALLAYQNGASGRFTTAAGGSGSYAANTTTAYACLALKAAGSASSAVTKGCRWLQAQASSSGGFSWNTSGSSADVDSTAAVVQALIRCGGVSRSASVITKALKFVKQSQQGNGGLAYTPGAAVSVESSSLGIQAIVAAGQNPASSAWRRGGKSPLDYVASRQAANGSFYHLGMISSVPLLTTSQAVMALQWRPLPIQ